MPPCLLLLNVTFPYPLLLALDLFRKILTLEFSEQQIQRYSRHILLEQIGGSGQASLINSKVLVIGAGGLGSPVILYLAAAGVGTIGVIDDDQACWRIVMNLEEVTYIFKKTGETDQGCLAYNSR